MSTKVATLPIDDKQSTDTPQTLPLERLIELVRIDARREARRYLDEVVVPKEAGE
jgi:hypothetical protein